MTMTSPVTTSDPVAPSAVSVTKPATAGSDAA